LLKPFREIIAAYSEINMKAINLLHSQNTTLLIAEAAIELPMSFKGIGLLEFTTSP
jgi:hypothetical protein